MADDLDARLIPHLRRADRLVVGKFADIRAHTRTGDLATATQRLADLHHALIGPDGSGAIGDAKAAFLRDGFGPFDPELHDPARRLPTPEAANAARTAPVMGVDHYREAAGIFDAARSALVTATAPRYDDLAVRNAAIDTWHGQHSGAVRAWVKRTLSNSQMAIHRVVGEWRLKPEYRTHQS